MGANEEIMVGHTPVRSGLLIVINSDKLILMAKIVRSELLQMLKEVSQNYSTAWVKLFDTISTH